MQKFTTHTGRAVPLRRSNVDTDQIIPVRFMTRTTTSGYGDALFHDWRQDEEFVLNKPEHQGGSVLVAGEDFGTGSSREAAVWALQDYGFRAVIAPRYGDIFRGNALQRGLLAIVLPVEAVERLWEHVELAPAAAITINLNECRVETAEHDYEFELDHHTRWRLLNGIDEVGLTLNHVAEIDAYERGRRPAMPTTRQAGRAGHCSRPSRH